MQEEGVGGEHGVQSEQVDNVVCGVANQYSSFVVKGDVAVGVSKSTIQKVLSSQ